MDINYINSMLKEGKSVKEIRKILGISKKKFGKERDKLGYEWSPKLKQYIPKNSSVEVIKASNSNSNILCNTSCNTEIIDNTDKENLNFIGENIELLKEMLMYYKRNKESNTNNNGIVIDLIDDKTIDNGKPKSVRVNQHVWLEWQEFTKKSTFSSKDLISMALVEYLEKYK